MKKKNKHENYTKNETKLQLYIEMMCNCTIKKECQI